MHPTGLVKPDDPDAKVDLLQTRVGYGRMIIDELGEGSGNDLILLVTYGSYPFSGKWDVSNQKEFSVSFTSERAIFHRWPRWERGSQGRSRHLSIDFPIDR